MKTLEEAYAKVTKDWEKLEADLREGPDPTDVMLEACGQVAAVTTPITSGVIGHVEEGEQLEGLL